MRAFWSSIAALVIITVAAWLVLDNVDMSAQSVYSRTDVRL